MDYGNVPTFSGSNNIISYSEKLYKKINRILSIIKSIDGEFAKDKRLIVKTYAELDKMDDKEADNYFEKNSVMLNEERKRIYGLNLTKEEKKIRLREIEEYKRHSQFMVYDYRKLSPFLKEKYVEKRIDETKKEYDLKKAEEIIKIKKEIEMYVKFLNRILIKYDARKEVFEEYKKISNHKFEDESIQKIYDDKLYETLIGLPELNRIVISYSEKEEHDSLIAKNDNLNNNTNDEPQSLSDENNNPTNFQQEKPLTEKEKINKIYELLDKAEKESAKEFLIDAYGYKLSLSESEEKKKIEQRIYKMIDMFKIKEIESILNNNPNEEGLNKARKLISELSFGPEKSTLIDYINKIENKSPIQDINENYDPQFNVYMTDEEYRPILKEDGAPLTLDEYEDEKTRQEVEQKISTIKKAG